VVDTEGGTVFEKNPLYLPELGANFRKGTADIHDKVAVVGQSVLSEHARSI
jgi:hypothetical protein